MSIDLNSNSFDAKEGAAIFNGGKAGLSGPVTMSLDKKKPEDKENAPDYKIIFTDETGASCNTSFWYITKDTQYQTVDQQTTRLGKILKHVAHAVLGANYSFPPYPDAKAMLDGVMAEVRKGLPSAGQFRIFANYGTKEYSKKFIQPRSWVPFMESTSVAIEDTRLVQGDLDCMERSQPDNVVPAGAMSAASSTSDDDWG
jgi:hypothetical protein